MPPIPPFPRPELPDRFLRWLETVREIIRTTPEFRTGTGTPEAVESAPRGTFFIRTDGGAGENLYFKTTDTGNTGWVAVV